MKRITGAVLLVAGLVAAPAAQGRTLDTASASGARAMAVARGGVRGPSWIEVTVRTGPRQRAEAGWLVVCTKRSRSHQKSGSARGTGTFTRRVALPVRDPGNCDISAAGRLSGSGRITVVLTAES